MKKSFTLIETVVVIAVIGLTLPVLFAIVLTLMRQQVKIYRLSQIKREGDYLISIMENTIRDKAISIHSIKPAVDANIVCSSDNSFSSGPPLYFLDETKKWFGYEGGVNTIASASAVSTINLTSNKTIISGFSISCSRKAIYSPPSVSISFTIEYNTTSTRPEETTSMYYQTRVKLRSY